MKAVSKSYFKQDPKVRENLEREIRIMKLLRNCEYVVHLHHVQVSGESNMYMTLDLGSIVAKMGKLLN